MRASIQEDGAAFVRAGPAPVSRGRVLVAEDNLVNQKLAIAMLAKIGYAADVVDNGSEAVESTLAGQYDAVLMDCRMPGMDGYRAASEIRRRESPSRRMPIIAMTADAMEGDRDRCIQAGMDDYLAKPVRLDLLAATLERWTAPDWRSRPAPPPPPSVAADRVPGDGQGSPLDPEIVAGLRELEEKRGADRISTLITVFLRDAESHLERLRLAVSQKDGRTVAERAHTLTGSIGSLGATRMAGLCAHLEAMGTQGLLGEARMALDAIEDEFGKVRSALEVEFPAAAP